MQRLLTNLFWNLQGLLQKRPLTDEIHGHVAAKTGLKVSLVLWAEDDSAVVENNDDLTKTAVMQLSE